MTPEQKANLQSIIRYVLLGLGTWFVGKNLLGTAIDATTWEGWMGAIVALIAAIWGMIDKTSGIEALQSAIRSLITILSTLAVSSGILSADKVAQIGGFIIMVIPVIYSYLSRTKSVAIAKGNLDVKTLSGVQPKKL